MHLDGNASEESRMCRKSTVSLKTRSWNVPCIAPPAIRVIEPRFEPTPGWSEVRERWRGLMVGVTPELRRNCRLDNIVVVGVQYPV
jgi:hypothetical protein